MTPFRQALVAISALVAAACGGPPGGSFYGTWIPGTPDTVWNVIALHDVRGCADVAYQQHSRDKALYAVSCTSTSNEWRYYLVNISRHFLHWLVLQIPPTGAKSMPSACRRRSIWGAGILESTGSGRSDEEHQGTR